MFDYKAERAPMRRDFLLIILSSPSGAGKTTLTRRLLKEMADLRFSVSHTTRPPRDGELDGRDYHFIGRDEFVERASNGSFVEWAEVHGNLYGTARSEIDRAMSEPGCGGLIFDIDYQGARQIRAKVPDVVGVFVLPPTMDELERRLRGRASETEEIVRRRFAVARKEIEHYALFDYMIVNDEIDRAFLHLTSIIFAERSRRFRRAESAEALLRNDSARNPSSTNC
jgi:guanylate kinase